MGDESFVVAGRRQEPGLTVDNHLLGPAVVEGDNGDLHRHRLGEHKAERFLEGRHGEHVGAGHHLRHVVRDRGDKVTVSLSLQLGDEILQAGSVLMILGDVVADDPEPHVGMRRHGRRRSL